MRSGSRLTLIVVSASLFLAGCGGGVVPGNDWVKCSCLFSPIAYNVDTCTNADADPGSEAYGGSDVHRSCVAKCGEEIGPLGLLAASPGHTVMRGGTCDAGDDAYGARIEPLMAADGPDTLNPTINPSSSRAVLRNLGSSPVTFMLLPIDDSHLSIRARRGLLEDGVSGLPAEITQITLSSSGYSGSFDGHVITDIDFTLNEHFSSTTNGDVGVLHWAQRNGIRVPAGQEVVFMANVDGVERWRLDTTTSSQSVALVRFGSPGGYSWHATYRAVLPIPETSYELDLELWFDFPLDVPPIVHETVPTFIGCCDVTVTPEVADPGGTGIKGFDWYKSTCGDVLSRDESPTFNFGQLGADCATVVVSTNSGQIQTDNVCLLPQGCSASPRCSALFPESPWSNSVGVVPTADGGLQKEVPGGWGAAGARSVEEMGKPGFMEFRVDSNLVRYVTGLSSKDPDQHYDSIAHAFHIRYDKAGVRKAHIREFGTVVKRLGVIEPGQYFRIDLDGFGLVTYRTGMERDNLPAVYSSQAMVQFPAFVDTALRQKGKPIPPVILSEHPWSKMVGVAPTAAGGLQKNVSGGWGVAGARSLDELNQPGFMEFRVDSSLVRYVTGLSSTDLDQHYDSIAHAFHIRYDKAGVRKAHIREFGTVVKRLGVVEPGQYFRIELNGFGGVTYSTGMERDNLPAVYSSQAMVQFPAFVDTALRQKGKPIPPVTITLNGDDYCAPQCAGEPAIVQEVADDHLTMAPWQSFKAPSSGNITAIELIPNCYNDGAGISGKLNVYSGTGTGGTLLHSEPFSCASDVTGWQSFELSTPLSVTSGQVMTWELSGANDLYHSLEDTYADGQASQSWADFAMRILMCF